jgi:mRNA interferase MazF
MTRGEIWWADLGIPFGSEPGFKRPVVIIQDDSFNRSRIQTVVVSAITTNLRLAEAPGNLYLEKSDSGLSKDGVINISQISTLDKQRLLEKVGTLSYEIVREMNAGLRLILNL